MYDPIQSAINSSVRASHTHTERLDMKTTKRLENLLKCILSVLFVCGNFCAVSKKAINVDAT